MEKYDNDIMEIHNKNSYVFYENYILGYDNKNNIFYIDKSDYEKIKDLYWYCSSGKIVNYNSGKPFYMHRYLLEDVIDPYTRVVHANGNGCDNRRINLKYKIKQSNKCEKRDIFLSEIDNSYIEEIWRDIPGYEGYYQISNHGNVRGLDRYVMNTGNYSKESKLIYVKGKMMAQKDPGNGHLVVHLTRDHKSKQFYVHRLVALAFIPNPDNLPIVNHKDENPLNNHVSNLEWATYQYNTNYGTCIERRSMAITRRIKRLSMTGEIIDEWDSIKDASKHTNVDPSSISACAKGKRNSAGGYKWEYNNE